MALPSNTVWEVRPGVGADTAGGGFVSGGSGTDFSQQNAAQFALTGLTSSGAGNTILSAAAATTMVDNIAQAISGTNVTAGFYRIVSVVAGVSITFGTNNSGGSICSGVVASGVINIGGALATVSAALAAVQPANIIYVKNTGTYTTTTAQTINVDSTGQANPLSIIGYGSSRGDGTKFTWTTSTNSTDIIHITPTLGLLLQNISFTCTAGTPGHCINCSTNSVNRGINLSNCIIDGFNIGVKGDFATNGYIVGLLIQDTIVRNCVANGVINDGLTIAIGSWFKSNGTTGITGPTDVTGAGTGILILRDCVVQGNTTIGVSQFLTPTYQNYLDIENCAIINNGSDGIRLTGNDPCSITLRNTIIDTNGGWGVNCGGKALSTDNRNNAYRNNTSGDRTGLTAGLSDVSLTGDPFTNRSTGDFSLNNTAGAGAACKAAGIQSSLF